MQEKWFVKQVILDRQSYNDSATRIRTAQVHIFISTKTVQRHLMLKDEPEKWDAPELHFKRHNKGSENLCQSWISVFLFCFLKLVLPD